MSDKTIFLIILISMTTIVTSIVIELMEYINV